MRTDPWKEFEVHRYTPRSQKHPWKELQFCNVVLGQGGGAARENPAASPAVLAGEGAGKVLGVVRDRLVRGFGADKSPVSSRGGTGRRWPRARMLR
jgi:hypothetical protein